MQKTEPWEADKTLEDMEKYFWEKNESKTKILKLLKDRKQVSLFQSEFTLKFKLCCSLSHTSDNNGQLSV